MGLEIRFIPSIKSYKQIIILYASIGLLLLCHNFLFGQSSSPISSNNSSVHLESKTNDDYPIEGALKRATNYGITYPDSALLVLSSWYKTNQFSLLTPSQKTQLLLDLSQYHFWNSDPFTATEIAEQAQVIVDSFPDNKFLLATYYRLAEGYEFTDCPKAGLEMYRRCYNIAALLEDNVTLAKLDVKMGDIELVSKHLHRADAFYVRAVNRLNPAVLEEQYYYYKALWEHYQVQLKLATAAESGTAILNLCSKIQELVQEVLTNTSLSELLDRYLDLNTTCVLESDDIAAILKMKLPAIEELEKQTTNLNRLQGRLNLYADLASRKKEFSKAIQYIEKSWDIAEEVGNLGMKINALDTKIAIFKTSKNYKEVARYLEIRDSCQQILAKQNRQNSINQLNVELETKEKELAIAFLKKEQAILKNNNLFLVLGVVGFALLALVALRYFLQSKKKNKTISQQSAAISIKNNQLEKLNLTKDHIFAIIGHDLRKPALSFRGITKNINYLLQKEDYKTLRQLGQTLEQEAFELNKLTDNLLYWALAQKDIMPYQPQRLPLDLVYRDVIDIFKTRTTQKGITLLFDIPQGLTVFADENALFSILRNLIDNSIKFTDKDGFIKLSAEAVQQQVKIKVEDNGLGMNRYELEHIFTIQKNKSQIGTDGEKGTGLGLHLISELVKLNLGTIEVESNVRKGTIFSILLPQNAPKEDK